MGTGNSRQTEPHGHGHGHGIGLGAHSLGESLEASAAVPQFMSVPRSRFRTIYASATLAQRYQGPPRPETI